MAQATFHPAILAKAKTYQLKNGVLSEMDENGQKWALSLADVESVAYVDAIFKKTRGTRLDLHYGDVCRSLRLGQPAGDWINNIDTREFLTFARAICLGLENAQPGIEITQGEYGRSRIIMFVIGILTLIFAIGIIGLAVITGVQTEKLFAGIVPISIMFLIGGYVSYTSRPWQVLAKMPAAGFARRFDRWLNPTQ